MKSLQYILISGLLTIAIFSAIVFSSCKNKCGGTVCQNGGTCSAGVCVCPVGFSGNACQTGWTTVLIGTYNCSRNSCVPVVVVNSADSTWQSAITTAATNPGYSINISNFDNSDLNITGTVDSNINDSSFVQISQASGTYGINASGFYFNDTIKIKFTTSSFGGVGGYTCEMLMVKEQ